MAYIVPQPVREKSAPYVFFDKLFSEDECAKIIALHANEQDARVGGGEADGQVDPTKRRTKVSWLNWEPDHTWIFEKLASSVAGANNQWWGFHLSGLNEALQLSHYREEDKGHYDFHTDYSESGSFSMRKISGIVLLKEATEGGTFEFFEGGAPKEMSVGSLILFPSHKLHRVTPVAKGDRWSLVFWVSGPPFC